jgi:mevalonate kinase
MNDFDKKMSEVFDVTPVEQVKKPQPVVTTHYKPPSDDKQDLVDAYQQSKENIQEIIDSGKDAMEEILQIAKAGQHPRAFEVYATLLKNMTEANDRLLKIQKEMRDIEGRKKDSGTTIDKAIFVGSTSELSKFLKGNNGS